MTQTLGRRTALAKLIATGAAVAGAGRLRAQPAPWPQRPLRLVIPFAAGGGTDVLGRLLAQRMAEGLGQPVVVDNKPGAGGSVGTADVAKAAPDGYTILMGSSSTHGINPGLYERLPYDPIGDFAPVGQIATNKFVMAVPADSPANTLPEFLAMMRAAPGKHDFASSGNGTTSHLAGALFVSMAGVRMNHIPYKSNAPALNDLIAGRVAVMFDNITAMQAQIEAGRVRPIATTGLTRSPILPQVPTLDEQGLKGYEIGGWFCLLAPAGTPASIVDRLAAELARVVALPEVSQKMVAIGADPQFGGPAELGALIGREIPRWKELIRVAGAKVE